MSATPRTDALDRQLAGFNAFKNLSSDLEAELAAAIARISELESHVRTDSSAVIARLEAECAGLRKDAERYRWFRLQGLWDVERFPWPDNFEYPAGISEDDGAMLDAAIDAARGKK